MLPTSLTLPFPTWHQLLSSGVHEIRGISTCSAERNTHCADMMDTVAVSANCLGPKIPLDVIQWFLSCSTSRIFEVSQAKLVFNTLHRLTGMLHGQYLLICWSFRFSPPGCQIFLAALDKMLRRVAKMTDLLMAFDGDLWSKIVESCRIQWIEGCYWSGSIVCTCFFLDSFGASTVCERTHPKIAEPTRKFQWCHVYLWAFDSIHHMDFYQAEFGRWISSCFMIHLFCKMSMLKLWRVRLKTK